VAKLVGETAGVSRFRSEAAFARYAGVAPVPHWSGRTRVRLRRVRSGNRQLNAALYRIALTQIRHRSPGQAYYRKRRDADDSPGEAMRHLERRIVRTVFARLRADYAKRPATFQHILSFPDLERLNGTGRARWRTSERCKRIDELG